MDSYRVVLIFKDPAEALVSRYFYNHCKNIRGAECGATPAEFPSLERWVGVLNRSRNLMPQFVLASKLKSCTLEVYDNEGFVRVVAFLVRFSVLLSLDQTYFLAGVLEGVGRAVLSQAAYEDESFQRFSTGPTLLLC